MGLSLEFARGVMCGAGGAARPAAPPLASELRAVHEARSATRVALLSSRARVLHASLHALVVSQE